MGAKSEALEILDLERLRENATKTIRLRIDSGKIRIGDLEHVARIIAEAERGNSRIYIDMILPDDPEIRKLEIEVGSRARIRPTALVQEHLEAILGEENVRFS